MSRPSRSSPQALWGRARSLWHLYGRDPDVLRGWRDMLPLLPGAATWGLVTGVAMVKVLGVPLALMMSLVVYSGGAQLAALPLLAAGAPVWVIVAAGFVVNLRFIIYSVQWRWFFGGLPRVQRLVLGFFATDQTYVLFAKAYPRPEPQPGQLGYFIGASASMCLAWQGASILGIVFADWVPTAWGLDFIGVLGLLGLMASLMKDRMSLVCAGVAGLAAVAAFALPYKLHIIAAVAAAVAAGLMMERLVGQRQVASNDPGGDTGVKP